MATIQEQVMKNSFGVSVTPSNLVTIKLVYATVMKIPFDKFSIFVYPDINGYLLKLDINPIKFFFKKLFADTKLIEGFLKHRGINSKILLVRDIKGFNVEKAIL
jgi:hypothetical protein